MSGRPLVPRASRLFGLAAALALAALLLPAAAADDVDVRLYLIGDAGAPAKGRPEPVLLALRNELERDPEKSFAVFLGDNVYPRGLRALGHPERPESERRLAEQLRAVRDSGAAFLFVPGNHDWDQHGEDGWNAIRRQASYVLEHGGGKARYEPQGGCPGPVPVRVGERLLLVALDTHWWLHPHAKPSEPAHGCPAAKPIEVAEALRDVVAGAGARQVVVVAHHPPASSGKHGGFFDWRDHLFPLRAFKGWLWLPLPLIGSAYPLARHAGWFPQDLTSEPYRRMLEALRPALAGRPLAWAAGHDHNLQVLEGKDVRHVLVSGAGIYGHTRSPKGLAETRFASGEAGFMRLELGRQGPARLAVLTVDARGNVREAYAARLE